MSERLFTPEASLPVRGLHGEPCDGGVTERA